jgi:uncharacterized protein (TIGR04551 family)
MTRLLLAWFAAALALAAPVVVLAQPEAEEGPGEEPEPDEPDDEDLEEEPLDEDAAWTEDDEAWAEGEEDDEPGLRAPQVENLELGDLEEAEEEDDEGLDEGDEPRAEAEDDEALPSPSEAQARLDAIEEGDGTDPTIARWTTPQTVFDLHGYIRFRGEFQDNFFFDRVPFDPMGRPLVNEADLPFRMFIPADDGSEACTVADDGRCDQNALAFANMRLRLEPTIHLSDDVRVRMQFDVFDNMVLGSTPNSFAVGPRSDDGVIDPYYRYDRTTFAPLDTAATTLVPPERNYNSLQDSIVARRAWAEVRNRTLGELRFGRMGSHWGLGILANGGSGLDADFQTDVDRIMLITRLAGIYIFGAWDFASEGLLYQEPADVGGLAFDRSRLDDTDQFVVGAAFRQTEEEARESLQRGDAVFNIGAYFVYRNQNLSSYGTTNPFGLCVICNRDTGSPTSPAGAIPEEQRRFDDPVFVRRGADIFVPDLWVQFMYESLRLELEAVMVLGTIENLASDVYAPGPDGENAANLLQFGLAFEGEYRLLNDQLGIHFAAGYASGDQDQEGLSQIGGLQPQLPNGSEDGADRTYSTFYFNPNYRIDLIFWRTVMRQIGGAYYFRPGLSYDFIRNSFGQLLGARADVVWSRASEPLQAYGNADDLGVEIDVSVYYRSEDGPDLLDGFYAQAQWGLFFPLQGLNYLPGTGASANFVDEDGDGNVDLGNAMTFRLLLGVRY